MTGLVCIKTWPVCLLQLHILGGGERRGNQRNATSDDLRQRANETNHGVAAAAQEDQLCWPSVRQPWPWPAAGAARLRRR